MPNKVRYELTAPYRSSMTFFIEAEEGLTHQEVCERVTDEDLENAEVNWECLDDSWYDYWNASYRAGLRYVSAWDCTAIFAYSKDGEDCERVRSEHQKKQLKETGYDET